jgi:hypothetical protein
MLAKEFRELADRLKMMGSPAAHRSATSRAYYYLFHTVFPHLNKHFRLDTSQGGAHKLIPNILLCSSDGGIKSIGSRMDTLREDRNLADYDLRDVTCEDVGFANRTVSDADKLTKEFVAILNDASKWNAFLDEVTVGTYKDKARPRLNTSQRPKT